MKKALAKAANGDRGVAFAKLCLSYVNKEDAEGNPAPLLTHRAEDVGGATQGEEAPTVRREGERNVRLGCAR